jgi:hypothetical protein
MIYDTDLEDSDVDINNCAYEYLQEKLVTKSWIS